MSMLKIQNIKQIIESNFPKVELAIGYGSSFFIQKDYDYKKNKPMIDLLFIVENSRQWHELNFKNNKQHYSGLAYLFGPKFLELMQNKFMPVHFNPFIQINNNITIKYGVVEYRSFLQDLNKWKNLICSGRLHKPVKFIIRNNDDEKLKESIQHNLIQAACVSLIFNYEPWVNQKTFFHTITSLSYAGDIRFKLKGENQNKIENIVEGNFENFQNLYSEIFKMDPIQKIAQFKENKIMININDKTADTLIEMIPYGLGVGYTGIEKDYVQSFKQISISDVQKALSLSIKKINQFNSMRMLMYHLITNSPKSNIMYATQKLKKYYKSI